MPPQFVDRNPDVVIRELCDESWNKKFKDKIPKGRHKEYLDRYEQEVSQIINQKFVV